MCYKTNAGYLSCLPIGISRLNAPSANSIINIAVFAGACRGKSTVLCKAIPITAITVAKAVPLGSGCLRCRIALKALFAHSNTSMAIMAAPTMPNSIAN